MIAQGPNLRLKGFQGYGGVGLHGYAGHGMRGYAGMLGDVPTDGATPVQRARMEFLATQLHALGISIQQAADRGDTETVTSLRAVAKKLAAEQLTLQRAIIAQTNAIKKTAEAGGYATPVENFMAGLKDTLTGAGLGAAIGLGLLTYFVFGRK